MKTGHITVVTASLLLLITLPACALAEKTLYWNRIDVTAHLAPVAAAPHPVVHPGVVAGDNRFS